jgi:asparagine synthetase B (glutamine-hydrolysing)
MNQQLPKYNLEDPKTPLHFLDVLAAAVSVRTRTIPQTHSHTYTLTSMTAPRIAVLFSGGLDCSVLAWLIHTLLPPDEPIDLINVAFENPRTIVTQNIKPADIYSACPDRITGLAGWRELIALAPARDWTFVEVHLTLY